MSTILIADDEPHIREVVRFAVQQAGFACVEASDGNEALTLFAAQQPALVLLDIKMPQMQGTDVCRALRAGSDVPIIFLTSCADEIDLVVGLELGADDYITKPFSPRELVSRIRAVLRRVTGGRQFQQAEGESGRGDGTLRRGHLCMDTESWEVRWDGQPVALTASEFGLLRTLMSHPGRVYTRDELMDRMYGNARHVSDRTVDSHVRRIRQAFAEVSGAPIATVRGVGYKLGTCQ